MARLALGAKCGSPGRPPTFCGASEAATPPGRSQTGAADLLRRLGGADPAGQQRRRGGAAEAEGAPAEEVAAGRLQTVFVEQVHHPASFSTRRHGTQLSRCRRDWFKFLCSKIAEPERC